MILNYNSCNAQAILDGEEKDFECFCGGKQLQYFKKEWERHLELLRNQSDKTRTGKLGDFETNTSINKE